jgi:serine/threonine-protein kinase
MSDPATAEDRVSALAEDFLERHRQGLEPSLESYVAAHPELADEIRRLFPALLMMEELKPASGDATGSFDGAAVVVRGARLERLGDFRILREVGRGGMGVVYEAEQESLGRRVALKVLASHSLADSAHLRRFEREARSAARLHHTNIVPVFGVGEQDGLHYYVMQFIQGLGLDEVVAELKRIRSADPEAPEAAPPATAGGPGAVPTAAGLARSLVTAQFAPTPALPDDPSATQVLAPDALGEPTSASPPRIVTDPLSRVMLGPAGLSSVSSPGDRYCRSVARIGVQVARALDYAHSQGIFHRDVKPSNLLLDVQGTSWVADFGLAKAVEGDNLTHTGDIVGTIRYMAPERFKGRCDARSDVYALGLTLYEMLTLRPAFEQTDRQTLIRQLMEEEPPRLRLLNPAVPRDLETVVQKAIDKDPAGRYPTAAVLAEDLALYLDGKPVRARQTNFLERCWKWAKRRPAVAALLAGLVAAISIGLGAVTWQWRTAVAARDDALAARNEALSAREVAQQNFELARKAVDDYLTRVGQNPLLKERGLHELRQELLGAALGYYRDFLRQRGDDPSVRAEVAGAHERVGDIELELGHPRDALVAYDQALALIEPLVRQRPSDPVLATTRIRIEAGRLQALKVGSWHPEVLIAYERVKGVGEALLASGGGTEDLPEILARANRDAAVVFQLMGRLDSAVRAALRAHELAERATRGRPGDLSVARTRLYVAMIAAEMLQSTGENVKATHLYVHEIAFGKAMILEHPRDVELRRDLATLEGGLSWLERARGRPLESLKLRRGAAEALAALARENPVLVQVRSHLSLQLENLSDLQTDLGEYDAAKQSARAAIEVNEALVREVPSSTFFRMKLGRAYGALGKALLKAGSHAEALAMLRKAVAILETSDGPWDLYNLATFLAQASAAVGPEEAEVAQRQRHDADRAMATIRRAIELGLTDSRMWKTESGFVALHARPDFQALLMDLDFPGNAFAP